MIGPVAAKIHGDRHAKTWLSTIRQTLGSRLCKNAGMTIGRTADVYSLHAIRAKAGAELQRKARQDLFLPIVEKFNDGFGFLRGSVGLDEQGVGALAHRFARPCLSCDRDRKSMARHRVRTPALRCLHLYLSNSIWYSFAKN
jgi:hypothetical protein